MYRLEIFDQNMDYVSVCFTENMAIELDYLAYTPFQVEVNSKEAKKGFYVHITEDDKVLADAVISDVKPDDKLQVLSLRPLQAIFDVDVFYTPVSDAITWIADNLDAQFISNADTLQLLPLNITATVGSSYPLMGYNFNKTINILSVICTAFTTYGVVTECSLDLVNKAINVNIFHQTATQVIECDLENIVEKEITLGDSYGSTNKYTIKKTLADGTDPNVSVTYYLHNDGTIDTTDSNRIVPVFFAVDTLEQTSNMTDADWLDAAETKAKEVLSPAEFDNEVIVTVHEDDKIVRPKDIQLGTVTSLMIGGNEYSSILSGVRIEAGLYTLTFGNVRTELTKKLTMAKRNSGSVTFTSGGGGGTYPVGSVVCMSTNDDPSTYYGGTWELIDKQFKHQQWLTANMSDIFTFEAATTITTGCINLREHCICIERMSVQTTSTISESTVTFGTFKLASLGVSGGAMSTNKYFTAQSDGGNGIAMMAITTSGIFETLDRVTVTSGGTIAGGNNMNFSFDIQLRMTEMLDSFCDKFYFKRTA